MSWVLGKRRRAKPRKERKKRLKSWTTKLVFWTMTEREGLEHGQGIVEAVEMCEPR
jgi:hypothetical protein